MRDPGCKGVAYDNFANVVCCGSKSSILNYLIVLLFCGIFVLRVTSHSYHEAIICYEMGRGTHRGCEIA